MKAWIFKNQKTGLISGSAVLLPGDQRPESPEGFDAEEGVLPKLDPVEQTQAQAEFIRAHRTKLLGACDWTQVPDAPLTNEQRTQWRTYRKALRELTDQADFPSGTQWPEPPNTPTKKAPQ
jgi:Phage tail assembly chaperone protein